ncbi:transcriptional repressor LexA [Candidatus Parcubacteria bacterium]|nr:transcriptional repressor LexA [Patescibacteria group bacterium]MCG2699385.1 transcriptional repressor LexA [Candidatus Parcubacteria bacterium]
MLTKRQKEILDFVESYSQKKGYSPSFEEIRKRLKLASVSTIHFHISKLKEGGFLGKTENKARAIIVASKDPMVKIPFLGTIAAGEPIEAIRQNEFIAVSKNILPSTGNLYALRVIGDSMVDENIKNGDVVLVKQQDTAENGERVVALIDNHEATLKKFYQERGHIRLQPANKTFEPIIIRKDRDIKIQGVVLDVIRNLDSNVDVETQQSPQQIQSAKVFDEVPINSVLHGDTISLLRRFPDKSVDLVLADPPYNLSKGNNINFQNKGLKGFGGKWNKVMEDWDNLPFVDYMNFTYEWLKEVKRVLKPTGSVWVFGTYHNIGLINTIFQILEVEIINEVVWYKRNAFPNLAGRRLTASHETLLWAHAGNGKRNYYFDYHASKEFSEDSDRLKERGRQMRTVWDIPNNKEREELRFGKHPTQKPLRVCRRIVKISSKPGDVVLAPFAGVGSECVAAKELGRRYIGIELEKEYVDIAKKRLSATNEIKTLFN